MTTITSETVLSSRHAQAHQRTVTTLLLRYPLVIHAEVLTHRVLSNEHGVDITASTPSLMHDQALSRNAGSSRAIPTEKLIAAVENDPFRPLVWLKDQPGMQGSQELEGIELQQAKDLWDNGLETALKTARNLAKTGAHKQIVNRVLAPYAHIQVVATGTEWKNFLELRDHTAAEPHMQMLAKEIRRCLKEPVEQTLQPGQWHLPFVDIGDFAALYNAGLSDEDVRTRAISLATARCASTSYLTVDGFDMTQERADRLHDKLIGATPIHASPAEHVCYADVLKPGAGGWAEEALSGNLGKGWVQYRKVVERDRAAAPTPRAA